MHRLRRRNTILMILLLVIVLVVIGVALLASRIDQIFGDIRMADCAWRGTAVVWNDTDRDGVRDDDEDPLANVSVYADDVQNDQVKVASGVSDAEGSAVLSAFIAGCPETAFEVYVEPAAGYCATTPERASAPPYEFGVALCE